MFPRFVQIGVEILLSRGNIWFLLADFKNVFYLLKSQGLIIKLDRKHSEFINTLLNEPLYVKRFRMDEEYLPKVSCQ